MKCIIFGNDGMWMVKFPASSTILFYPQINRISNKYFYLCKGRGKFLFCRKFKNTTEAVECEGYQFCCEHLLLQINGKFYWWNDEPEGGLLEDNPVYEVLGDIFVIKREKDYRVVCGKNFFYCKSYRSNQKPIVSQGVRKKTLYDIMEMTLDGDRKSWISLIETKVYEKIEKSFITRQHSVDEAYNLYLFAMSFNEKWQGRKKPFYKGDGGFLSIVEREVDKKKSLSFGYQLSLDPKRPQNADVRFDIDLQKVMNGHGGYIVSCHNPFVIGVFDDVIFSPKDDCNEIKLICVDDKGNITSCTKLIGKYENDQLLCWKEEE